MFRSGLSLLIRIIAVRMGLVAINIYVPIIAPLQLSVNLKLILSYRLGALFVNFHAPAGLAEMLKFQRFLVKS